MSEDEGPNPATQGVSSGEQSDGDDATDEPSTADCGHERAEEPSASDASDRRPELEDVEALSDRVADLDPEDELAEEVDAIVEAAREHAETVESQRAELEDLEERSAAQAETIEELQARLDERDAELERREERIDELESSLKRNQADFQNYKKRAKKRQEQLKERATEDLVGRLVGVRDNLTRALEEESDDVEALREGVEMTLREFDRVLEDENVEEIAPEPGAEVDPQRHEVMVTVDSALPEGAIDDVFAPGYEMGGKVIRSAQVTVSNGELAADEARDDDAIELDGDVAADEASSEASAAGSSQDEDGTRD